MAQASLHRFFNTRKRPANDDLSKINKKVLLLENDATSGLLPEPQETITKETPSATNTRSSRRIKQKLDFGQDDATDEASAPKTPRNAPAAKKVVSFTQAGPLSPKKRLRSRGEVPKTILKAPAASTTTILSNDINAAPGAPKKKLQDLSLADIKGKLSNPENARIVRESLKQFAELDRKRQELRKLNSLAVTTNAAVPTPADVQSPGKQLKPFSAIELDIESPCKNNASPFKTPEKIHKTPTPQKQPSLAKDELMSPRPMTVRNPKRLLFSPAKIASDPSLAPAPAHEKYRHLIAPQQSLELPYKYRCLEELFKCCDTVCAIFYNRKERITFKKLKPAVERMCRKTFTEAHLAQIKHVLPDVYELHQHKMRNFGSVSKYDYYQLVITPVIDKSVGSSVEQQPEDADQLSSQRLMARLKRFHSRLFDMTADKHDEFLKSLQPPMTVNRAKLMRWHPDFDIQSCEDIPKAPLPQPPNAEKFNSAKDVLSTARNLFNCATPMERALQRLEAKKMEKLDQKVAEEQQQKEKEGEKKTTTTDEAAPAPSAPSTSTNDPMAQMLKGVPASLLAKIREKQAAKALSVMTRRPSQEKEAIVYARLPDLARHVRNVFVTEKKACLTTELVMGKLMNSFRTSLTPSVMDDHLRLLAKESDGWITYHEIQRIKYMKLNRQTDFAQMMERLKKLADEKAAD